MKGTAMRKYAAVIGILAGVAAIGMGFYIHAASPSSGRRGTLSASSSPARGWFWGSAS